MKYSSPLVASTGIMPRDQSCSNPTVFSCSKNPFQCEGAFSCSKDWWKGCSKRYVTPS